MKILVVEDNERNLILLRDILSYAGHEVIEAADGAEGVRLAKEHMPGLILMDIQLPVMDGVEAMKILKGSEETKEIKILALTSFAMQGDKEKLLAQGFDGYMSKPIDPDELIEAIKNSRQD